MTPHDLSNYVNGVDSYGHDATDIHPVQDIQDLKETSGLWLQFRGIKLAPCTPLLVQRLHQALSHDTSQTCKRSNLPPVME